MRGRYAPSPTGKLHLGNARTALLAWLQVRAEGGTFLLRIEDLDPARRRQANIDALFFDLEYLGLDWDEPPLFQSRRTDAYAQALSKLAQAGKLYPCFCTRAEVARAALAPHGQLEDGPKYPGTCSKLPGPDPHPESPRSAAQRFRVAPGLWQLEDLVQGFYAQDVAEAVGDFVVQRTDGVASYQLAVVVDDAASEITEVLRGEDLLGSTPRQLQLYQALGLPPPRYAHVPLLMGTDGKRLAKREGALALSDLRASGVPGERVVALLARWSGLGQHESVSARELVPAFSLKKVPREPVVVTEEDVSKRLALG